jgi:hypothetical protein
MLVTALFAGISLFSQGNENTTKSIEDRKHEIKLDGIKLIAGSILETTYEFVQNKNSGFGASLLINLDSDNDYLEDFSISPFYRMYFFNKEDYGAKGFFVEGFGKYANGDDAYFGNQEETYNDFSLGMSLGKKWINSSGFVFELLVGVSRSLGGDVGHDAYFRGGLFVGYRL